MALVETKDISKVFGKVRAVEKVNLSVNQGEVFGLLGPNGAGKSTILAMITGLISPTEGDAYVGEISVREKPGQVQSMLGVVPQDVALYPRLSARANLRFWGEMYGLKGASLSARIDEVLEMVGLSSRANESLSKYSGGMKRRINIAAGLLHRPRVLILDEPTVGVDPQSRNRVFDLVKELNRQGATVIYTSHYMEEVEALCERVAIMDEGRVIASGALNELLRQAGEYQQVLIGSPGLDETLIARLRGIPVIEKVHVDDTEVCLVTQEAEKALALAFGCFAGAGCKISRIDIRKPNLESLFMKLTGKTLRD